MSDSRIATSFLPTSAVLEMTYQCNHKCLFCSCPWEYSKSGYIKSKELSIDEWKNCIASLIELGITDLSYTGGEPLMKKGIKEIISFANTLNATFYDEDLAIEKKAPNQYLISNGQLLDNTTLEFLRENNIRLSLSLPGLKTYHKHTQNGSSDTILNLLNRASKLGIHTVVNVTVTKINFNELYEIISNAMLAGANTLLLNRFLPGGRGMQYFSELFLTREETIQMLKIADEVLRKANRKGSLGTEIPICLIKDIQFSNLTVGTRCSAAVGFFVIGPEGRIRTCNHSPMQLEHFTNIINLKTNHYWQKFVFKDYLPDTCKDCFLTNSCDGGCREAAHIFSGELTGNDPLFMLSHHG